MAVQKALWGLLAPLWVSANGSAAVGSAAGTRGALHCSDVALVPLGSAGRCCGFPGPGRSLELPG